MNPPLHQGSYPQTKVSHFKEKYKGLLEVHYNCNRVLTVTYVRWRTAIQGPCPFLRSQLLDKSLSSWPLLHKKAVSKYGLGWYKFVWQLFTCQVLKVAHPFIMLQLRREFGAMRCLEIHLTAYITSPVFRLRCGL